MITGNDLIRLGYKPAKWFGKALKLINTWERGGIEILDKDIPIMVDPFLPEPEILPHDKPVHYHLNLDANTADELKNRESVIETMNVVMKTPTVIGGAVMPDACPVGAPGVIPVGGVVVAKNAIHPSMHSSDMCCSVYATNFGKIRPEHVLKLAHGITQFGPGGRKGFWDWSRLLDDNASLRDDINRNYFTFDYMEKAATHLGTQGDGNHFLFVGISENTGDTYMVTHHGSRGFGASVYKKGMHVAEKYRRELSPKTHKDNAWIPFNTIEGALYWDAIQIVREWTKLNHSAIHNKVLNAVGIAAVDSFWNEHNSVFKDGDLFYHAKGATPLLDKFVPDSQDGLRLIPLNMAEPILVVRGTENDNNLGFAPHGAGRNMSRAEHRRRIEATGLTKEAVLKQETAGLTVKFYSGKPDVTELPSAYKNAGEVQQQMEKFGLGTVVDRIMPHGCIMAGEQDAPWKNKKKK